jgi:DNA-binding NarL/FixJ family response regulator
LDAIKITPRDEEVLGLLAQGCSSKEIAGHLNISPRTVKQHLRTLFLRAGMTQGRKRVKLATAMFLNEQVESCSPAIRSHKKKFRWPQLVRAGLTNRDIAKVIATSEQVVKNYLRTTVDKLGFGAGWNSRCTSPVTAL